MAANVSSSALLEMSMAAMRSLSAMRVSTYDCCTLYQTIILAL